MYEIEYNYFQIYLFIKILIIGTAIPLHQNNSTYISHDIAKYKLPVYERLCSLDLLQRCQMGLTQNSNESPLNVIWSRCPKVLTNEL